MIRCCWWSHILIILLITSCGTTHTPATVDLQITNNDPVAEPALSTLVVNAPQGWQSTGGNITNEIFVVSALTLSTFSADPNVVLASMSEQVQEKNKRTVALEYQSSDTLIAWFILDNGTLTSLRMQSRIPVAFSQENRNVLVAMAQSARIPSASN